MADVLNRAQRSYCMSRIRGRGNKETELAMIELFRSRQIKGWRRHQRVYGRPDFVFPKLKVAVFVDGCFWHGCPKHSNLPVNNREFWRAKLQSNKRRDRDVNRKLRHAGWKVIRIWGHDLRKTARDRLVRRIELAIRQPNDMRSRE